VNDTYTWSSSGTGPDGTAFTNFLSVLNGGATGVGNCVSSDATTSTGGFDNGCDWRLPTIVEWQTIINTGCGSGPCIDPIFGPTQPTPSGSGYSGYWSSTDFPFPGDKWLVNDAGVVGTNEKFNLFVRAVRGGS
jgi:hypothetical protein